MTYNYLHIERNRRIFYRFLLARNLAKASTFLFYVYFIWELVARFHSVFLAGLIPAFSLLGYLIIVVPEGHLLDRRNRSRVFFIADVLLVLAYLLLFIGNTIIIVMATDLISSMLAWVASDSLQGMIKSIMPEDQYGKAVSMNQTGTAISEILGIVGGGTMIYLGISYLRIFLVILALLSAALSFPIVMESADTSGKNYGEVFVFIRKMAFLLILSLILNGLFISLDVYGSGLIRLVLHAPAAYYTLFLLGFPVGSVLGGVLISMGKISSKLSLMLVTVEVMLVGILLLGVAIVPDVIAEPFLTLALGVDIISINVQLSAFSLRVIPNDLTGRYNSISVLFSAGASPVMALLFSLLSRFLYFPVVLEGAALIAIAVAPLTYFALKSMMHAFGVDDKKGAGA
ncbi:MAG: MFS transporter [Thermoplasmataceae archaeon]